MKPDTCTILGRVVRADNAGFEFSCSNEALESILLGQLVVAPGGRLGDVYGIVNGISWSSDEFAQQIAQAESVHAGVLADSQVQRLAGPTISVLIVGYTTDAAKTVVHALPPQPPIRLEQIYVCSPEQARAFSGRSTGYLRLVVTASAVEQVGELLGAHLRWLRPLHAAAGDPGWATRVMKSAIKYLRRDPRLIEILEAITAANPDLSWEGTHV